MMLRRWQRRFRYWRQREQRSRALREEMEFHLAMRAGELMEEGMSEAQARSEARRQFGNRTSKYEESRAAWLSRWPGDLVQDAQFALRSIGRQPGFAVAAVLSTALGIGACSLIFGIANRALLRPLPVTDPSALANITGASPRRGKIGQSLSYPEIEDLRQARSFEGITAFVEAVPAAISGGGDSQRYWGSVVTANYFDIVRPEFAAGHGFDAAKDDRTGETAAIVLSHRLWRTRFGGDPAIVGRAIDWNGRKVAVAGITGPGFLGTDGTFYADFWVPFSMLGSLGEAAPRADRLRDRNSNWLYATARLRPGASMNEAAAEARVLAERIGAAHNNRNRTFHVERAGRANPGARQMLLGLFLLLSATAALVLFAACGNVANLLLARAAARRKEIATRLAIGAGRGRLVRQLLTESTVLALAGGAAGFAIAQAGAAGLSRLQIPLSMPVELSLPLDYRVVLFCIALSAISGVAFGLAPALRATRADLTGALKDERAFGGSRRFGLRDLLVIGQVAISMLLLVSAGLFWRSLESARRIDPGFATRNLLLVGLDPGLNGYPPEASARMMDTVVNRVRAIPGVQSVSLGDSVPLSMEGTQNTFSVEDGAAGKQSIQADIFSVSPGYFDTLGIRLLDGADFREARPPADVVVLNQAAAARAFPGQTAVGREIQYFGRRVRIVGVVATTKIRSIGEDPRACLFFPIVRAVRGNDSLTGMTLVLRTGGSPAAFSAPVRQAIREVDAELPVFDIRTMEAHLSRALVFPRMAALLFGLAGCMGLAIASVGIYGLISFAVARRTREIGIRMALGAGRGRVLASVLKHGLGLTVVGSVLGMGLALVAGRVASSLLYAISAHDAVTLIAAPAFLLLVAAAACLGPARRAASVEPLRALRWE